MNTYYIILGVALYMIFCIQCYKAVQRANASEESRNINAKAVAEILGVSRSEAKRRLEANAQLGFFNFAFQHPVRAFLLVPLGIVRDVFSYVTQ